MCWSIFMIWMWSGIVFNFLMRFWRYVMCLMRLLLIDWRSLSSWVLLNWWSLIFFRRSLIGCVWSFSGWWMLISWRVIRGCWCMWRWWSFVGWLNLLRFSWWSWFGGILSVSVMLFGCWVCWRWVSDLLLSWKFVRWCGKLSCLMVFIWSLGRCVFFLWRCLVFRMVSVLLFLLSCVIWLRCWWSFFWRVFWFGGLLGRVIVKVLMGWFRMNSRRFLISFEMVSLRYLFWYLLWRRVLMCLRLILCFFLNLCWLLFGLFSGRGGLVGRLMVVWLFFLWRIFVMRCIFGYCVVVRRWCKMSFEILRVWLMILKLNLIFFNVIFWCLWEMMLV